MSRSRAYPLLVINDPPLHPDILNDRAQYWRRHRNSPNPLGTVTNCSDTPPIWVVRDGQEYWGDQYNHGYRWVVEGVTLGKHTRHRK